MNDKMHVLVLMTALGIHEARGAVHAIAFLTRYGWTYRQALDVIEAWEVIQQRIKDGTI